MLNAFLCLVQRQMFHLRVGACGATGATLPDPMDTLSRENVCNCCSPLVVFVTEQTVSCGCEYATDVFFPYLVVDVQNNFQAIRGAFSWSGCCFSVIKFVGGKQVVQCAGSCNRNDSCQKEELKFGTVPNALVWTIDRKSRQASWPFCTKPYCAMLMVQKRKCMWTFLWNWCTWGPWHWKRVVDHILGVVGVKVKLWNFVQKYTLQRDFWHLFGKSHGLFWISMATCREILEFIANMTRHTRAHDTGERNGFWSLQLGRRLGFTTRTTTAPATTRFLSSYFPLNEK